MYDAHSARLLRTTDWRRFGAVLNPPYELRKWGEPLNETELEALGQARLAAASQGVAGQLFWQHHFVDQTAFILCRADARADIGWEILIIGEDGQPSGWVLKADRGAALVCKCHCDWNASCPGVVSLSPSSVPPTPSPMVGMAEPAPAPRPAPAAPARASWRERRRERVARHMGWAQPAATVAEPEQAAAVPSTWRWPEPAGEEYRGEIHAHHYEQTDSSPAWPALHHHPVEEPAPAVEAAPARRSWLAALLGGGAAAVAAPAVVEAAPSVPSTWLWPEPAGEQYRGELHEPQPAAIEQEWRWPDALPGPAVESPLAIEHSGEAWPALPTPDHLGWDMETAAMGEPEPSYAALPAPKPEAPQLSSQAEIDSFIEASWANGA